MNHKLLLPTYRARQGWVRARVAELAERGPIAQALDLGAGEGEMDRVLAPHVEALESCDIDPGDVRTAKELNADLQNVRYSVQDGTRTSFAGGRFDLVACLEVVEHVDDPRALVGEASRLLRPGGTLLLTCPSHDFPVTYDPINAALRTRRRPLPVGAYGFGHTWLVRDEVARTWLAEHGLTVVRADRLSHHLVGLAELYAPGLLQRLLKPNAGNGRGEGGEGRGPRVVPDRADPPFLAVTDAINALDEALFANSDRSVGLAYVAVKDA